MKRLMIISLLLMLVSSAFAQKHIADPSYSTHNYKQANKAAIASLKNLDKIVALRPVLVQGGSEYKHPYNQSFLVIKASANTGKVAKERKGYKHPLGL